MKSWSYGHITMTFLKKKKKRKERVKIWTAIDRGRNKVVTFEISKDNDSNDKYHCRKLLNNIKSNYDINIIATDGNYSYNKVIRIKDEVIRKDSSSNNMILYRDCNEHIIDKSETCLVRQTSIVDIIIYLYNTI